MVSKNPNIVFEYFRASNTFFALGLLLIQELEKG